MKKLLINVSAILLVSTMLFTSCTSTSDKNMATETEKSTTEATTETGETAEATEVAKESTSKYDTLVVGTSELNGVFNPFFYTTGYDAEIILMSVDSLISNSRSGEPTDGIAKYTTPVEVKDADGNITSTVYTFEIKEGIKFSDGSLITADDIIFAYKVLLDPTYTGISTLFTTPILGVNEYRYDDVDYKSKIEEIKAKSEEITDDEIKAYIRTRSEADVANTDPADIIDYLQFDNSANLEGDALTEALTNAYYEKEIAEYFDDYKGDAIADLYKKLEKEYIDVNMANESSNVEEIEGIKKIDDKTVEITIEGVDPKAIWNLGGIDIVPKSYYGVGLADGPNAGKEFKKGDLSMVKEKQVPTGSGPYLFTGYENNVVSFEANPNYYLGEPKIKKMKYQVTPQQSKLESVKLGDIDISDPSASPQMVKDVEEAGLHYELIENLGYGYIGLSATRVPDINVRKGLMSLMNRKPAVDTYYGELASVIERPMSKISWAYPEDAQPVYTFSAEKALEYFTAAGYVQTEENGKKVLAKDGVQLKYEIAIAGNGIMDHPAAPILTQMKDELEKMGGVLEIQDVAGNILFDKLDAGQWDLWVAAWSSSIDPDMYQVYHSEGASNRTGYKNEELDKLIIEARQTNDIDVRKVAYAKALDIIMDDAIEMPVYQRKNMNIFNPEIINVDTLAKELSPFYRYYKEIETLELR